MNPQDAVDFSREALKTCMMVGGPILAFSLLIGLLVGVFQAMTQVQDQTVSFVPKILLLIVMIGLCLPWLTDQMLDFSRLAFEKPMIQWNGSSHQSLFPESNKNANSAETIPVSFTPPGTAKLRGEWNNKKTADKAESAVLPIPSNGRSDATPILPTIPSKSPFILPHYRTSKLPKSEIGG